MSDDLLATYDHAVDAADAYAQSWVEYDPTGAALLFCRWTDGCGLDCTPLDNAGPPLSPVGGYTVAVHLNREVLRAAGLDPASLPEPDLVEVRKRRSRRIAALQGLVHKVEGTRETGVF